jgi:hypothetical protein
MRRVQACGHVTQARGLCFASDPPESPALFSDGEARLRELQRKVAPNATHILDWFHVAMRFEHLLNVAQGQPPPEPSALADMRA